MTKTRRVAIAVCLVVVVIGVIVGGIAGRTDTRFVAALATLAVSTIGVRLVIEDARHNKG